MKRLWQFHLSTIIALSLAAGTMMWVNFRERRIDIPPLDAPLRVRGWPWDVTATVELPPHTFKTLLEGLETNEEIGARVTMLSAEFTARDTQKEIAAHSAWHLFLNICAGLACSIAASVLAELSARTLLRRRKAGTPAISAVQSPRS